MRLQYCNIMSYKTFMFQATFFHLRYKSSTGSATTVINVRAWGFFDLPRRMTTSIKGDFVDHKKKSIPKLALRSMCV